MKHRNIYKQLLMILFLTFSLSGCEDFLDVNEDPNAVLAGNNAQQLTFAELILGTSISANGAGFGSVLGEWTFQFSAGWGEKYQILGSAYMIETPWDAIYTGALQDLEDMIQRSEAEGDLIYAGIAKLLKAYYYSILVDLFGDVPFSQANNFLEYPMPEYDPGETIYPQLFLLIDEAKTDMLDNQAENAQIPGADDIIYGGNTTYWLAFANSLKLKLYNQVRLVDEMFDQSAVNSLLSMDLIDNSAEDFEIQYLNISTPEARHPGYVEEYRDPSSYFYIDPWFYETMLGVNDFVITPEYPDPRIPYYWYNQLDSNKTPSNNPEYQHERFVSRIFGSDGTDHNADVSDGATVLGIYPIGGRFDNGYGGRVTADKENSGTGQAPIRILCSYDVYFIRAELALEGHTSENPAQLLRSGIMAAFNKVNEVVSNSGTAQAVPSIHDTLITPYVDSVIVLFNSASNDEERLSIIMTQKWIAGFGSTVDAYTDYRRTGFPIFFDPNNMVLELGPADAASYTSVSRSYPNSLPWPSTPLSVNINAPDQKSIGTPAAKVFWDVD